MSASTGDGSWQPGRITEGFRRYQVVAASVAAIVVLARLTGGGFTVDRHRTSANAVTPFVSPSSSEQALATPGPANTALTVPSFDTTRAPAIAGSVSYPSATDDSTSTPSDTHPEGPLFATVPAPGAPTAIAVSAAGDVWLGAAASDKPKLFRYSSAGDLLATLEPGGVKQGVTALVATDGGSLFVAARSPASVFVVDPATGAAKPYATVPDVTPCIPPVVVADCDASLVNRPPQLSAMAFDRSGNLFVADAAQGAIWRIPRGGGDAKQWYTGIGWTGPADGTGPSGLAVDGSGNLVVTLEATLTGDAGAVWLVRRADDGTAGAATQLATTDAGARPSAVAISASGKLYIPLRGAGKVLVLDPQGKELTRLPSGDDAVLATPIGIVFTDDRILVTDQAPDDPANGRVVRINAGERGGTVYGARNP